MLHLAADIAQARDNKQASYFEMTCSASHMHFSDNKQVLADLVQKTYYWMCPQPND
jgi:hypothetical protein